MSTSTVSCSDSESSTDSINIDLAMWRLERKHRVQVMALRLENSNVLRRMVNQQIEMSRLQTKYLELKQKFDIVNIKLRNVDKVKKTLRSGLARPDNPY